MAHPADDREGLVETDTEVPLLLVIIFNFSYKNLDVYQYCLSLVLLLMFFISVSLVFKSQQQALNSGPPLLPKASPRGATRGPQCPGGAPALRAAGRHAQPAPARASRVSGLSPAPPPLRAQESPYSLGARLLLSLLPSVLLRGPRWPQSNAGHPGLGLPRRTPHTAPCQEANSPGS